MFLCVPVQVTLESAIQDALNLEIEEHSHVCALSSLPFKGGSCPCIWAEQEAENSSPYTNPETHWNDPEAWIPARFWWRYGSLNVSSACAMALESTNCNNCWLLQSPCCFAWADERTPSDCRVDGKAQFTSRGGVCSLRYSSDHMDWIRKIVPRKS